MSYNRDLIEGYRLVRALRRTHEFRFNIRIRAQALATMYARNRLHHQVAWPALMWHVTAEDVERANKAAEESTL